MSAVRPWAASARSMPTCIDPKLPPPAKTKAVFPWPERVPSVPPRNAAKSLMAATVRPQLSRHTSSQTRMRIASGRYRAACPRHSVWLPLLSLVANGHASFRSNPTSSPAYRPPRGRASGGLSDGQRHHVHREQDNDQDEHAAGDSPDPGFHGLVHALVAAGERRGGCCIRGHWLRLLGSVKLRLLKLRKTPELKCRFLMMSIALRYCWRGNTPGRPELF